MKTLKKYMIASTVALTLFSCQKENITPNNNPVVNQKSSSVSNSQGGSLAQFTIIDDYLYTVDYKSIKIFSISNAESPTLINSINLGVGVETIHAYNDYLFIGTNSGVKIIDASNRTDIEEVSEFEHVTSCDPVVANSNIAVSTLRGGTDCGGDDNEFDIIDITDITEPYLLNSFELDSPYGLSFSKTNPNLVYICDGASGLKAFDITDFYDIVETMSINSLFAKDIIVTDQQTVIILGQDGIHQFDATNETNLIEKSVINVSL